MELFLKVDLKKPLQERKVRPSPRISKQERRFNEKGMKNEDKDTKKVYQKVRFLPMIILSRSFLHVWIVKSTYSF